MHALYFTFSFILCIFSVFKWKKNRYFLQIDLIWSYHFSIEWHSLWHDMIEPELEKFQRRCLCWRRRARVRGVGGEREGEGEGSEKDSEKIKWEKKSRKLEWRSAKLKECAEREKEAARFLLPPLFSHTALPGIRGSEIIWQVFLCRIFSLSLVSFSARKSDNAWLWLKKLQALG